MSVNVSEVPLSRVVEKLAWSWRFCCSNVAAVVYWPTISGGDGGALEYCRRKPQNG